MDWSITCIVELYDLIYRLTWGAWSKLELLGAHLDHWNEWLGAWGKRVTRQSHIDAEWWINLLMAKVSVLGGLGRTQESLTCLGGLTFERLGLLKSTSIHWLKEFLCLELTSVE